MNDRLSLLNQWLTGTIGITDYEINKASEDASFRQYFRLIHAGKTDIIMDAPPAKEPLTDFINIAERLYQAGLHAPFVKEQNITEGFLILEDLGNTLYLDVLDDRNVDDLYSAAIESIHVMQNEVSTEGLPLFDETLLMEEMMLFHDWLLTAHLKLSLDSVQEEMLKQCFHFLVQNALLQPQVFVHRDYHSRNLMVTYKAPGIIDFQDAVRGPLTYDLVSLLKDCYIKWPPHKIENGLSMFYSDKKHEIYDFQQLKVWFDLMGVQRHLKASGIFARLYHRDDKAGFLKDIPRTLSYIVDLKGSYPQLDPLVEYLEQDVMPPLKSQAD